MNKKDSSYLPKQRTNYHPTESEVESATGVDFPINMPNPAVDSIVVNNIAYQEFDYTESMLDTEDSFICLLYTSISICVSIVCISIGISVSSCII